MKFIVISTDPRSQVIRPFRGATIALQRDLAYLVKANNHYWKHDSLTPVWFLCEDGSFIRLLEGIFSNDVSLDVWTDSVHDVDLVYKKFIKWYKKKFP